MSYFVNQHFFSYLYGYIIIFYYDLNVEEKTFSEPSKLNGNLRQIQTTKRSP